MKCPFCQLTLNFDDKSLENYIAASCLHGRFLETQLGIWAFGDKASGDLISYFINFPIDDKVYGFDTGNTIKPNSMVPGFVGTHSSTLSIFKADNNGATIKPFLQINQYIEPLPQIQDYEKLFQRYLQLKAFF